MPDPLILAAWIGFAGVVLAALISLFAHGNGPGVPTLPSTSTSPPVERVRATIEQPVSDSTVGLSGSVSGRTSEIPSGWELWVLVTPPGPARRYYPQPGPATIAPDGSFAGIAYYGDTSFASIGSYLVTVVLANAAAARQFHGYVADGSGGVSPLPLGATILNSVKVSRH
jgi:hypothetical protein